MRKRPSGRGNIFFLNYFNVIFFFQLFFPLNFFSIHLYTFCVACEAYRHIGITLSVVRLSHFPKLCFAGDTCIPRNAATIFYYSPIIFFRNFSLL